MGIATWIPRHWQRMYRLLPDQFPTNAQRPTGSAWEHLIATVSTDIPVDDVTEVDATARTIAIFGDGTTRYPVGFLVEIGGSSLVPRAFDGANDGRFTVTAVSYDAVVDRTVVTVAEEFTCPTCSELGFLRPNDSASLATGIQEVEEVLFDLRNAWNLTQATGAMLERLGEILGLSRTSTDDDEYRDDLRIQAAINHSNGRHFQIIDAIAALLGVTSVDCRDLYPAHIRCAIVGALPASGTRDRIFSMKGGGISMDLVIWGAANPFVMGDSVDAAGLPSPFGEPTVGEGFAWAEAPVAITAGAPGFGSFDVTDAAGLLAAIFVVGETLRVRFSTSNDDTYTIVSAVNAVGITTITVAETVAAFGASLGVVQYGSEATSGWFSGLWTP